MKNLFVIIFIVSSINCSFLRKLTGSAISDVTLNKQCIILGSNDEATLTLTVDKVGDAAPGTSLTATFTLEGSDSTKIETTCNTSGEGSVNFTCQLRGDNFQSSGNYKLKTINDTDVSTLTSSLKVAQTYELDTQTNTPQTINEEKKSFKIVFKGAVEDSLVSQIFATANSESSIKGCSKDTNTVICTPTTSEMPVGTYTIHYLNGCDKESTGVTVQVSSSGTGSGTGTGTGSGSGTGAGSGSGGSGTGTGTGTGNETGNGTSTGNGTETNSESKSAFITLSTLTLFVFGILF